MNMNISQNKILFLGIVLLFIVMFSLSKVEPIPYRNESVFTNAYPYYEGLENVNPGTISTTPSTTSTTPTPTPTTIPSISSTFNILTGTTTPSRESSSLLSLT